MERNGIRHRDFLRVKEMAVDIANFAVFLFIR